MLVVFASVTGKEERAVSENFKYDTCRYDGYFDYRKGT